MKAIKAVLLLICCFYCLSSFGQEYNYPQSNSKTENDLIIVKVLRNEYFTRVYFEYKRSESNGIYIFLHAPKTAGALYISSGGTVYNLIGTNAIGNTDKITAAYPNTIVDFSADFEALPKTVNKFDLIEPGGNWNFYGVSLVDEIEVAPDLDNFSEVDFQKRFDENNSNLEPIEGIWSINYTYKVFNNYGNMIDVNSFQQSSKSAIIKYNGNYKSFNLSNKSLDVVTFISASAAGIYLYNKYSHDLNENIKANAILSDGILKYSYEYSSSQLNRLLHSNMDGGKAIFEFTWIKIYPKENAEPKIEKSSGTGFSISSDGYIATNHHVIDGARKIQIRGINGDFSKLFVAKVVIDDKNNDLAVLKIDDPNFVSVGPIPYIISKNSADVGSAIFVFGYPLRASMGDEVKLTNGIISSKSGFQGDVTSYQVSAPVQPGNSGGPLFDISGNLIGIINAKNIAAENASYAIKSAYLLNLIDLLPNRPKLQTVSSLGKNSLVEQVKIIKNFTYIVEVSY